MINYKYMLGIKIPSTKYCNHECTKMEFRIVKMSTNKPMMMTELVHVGLTIHVACGIFTTTPPLCTSCSVKTHLALWLLRSRLASHRRGTPPTVSVYGRWSSVRRSRSMRWGREVACSPSLAPRWSTGLNSAQLWVSRT